MADKSLDLLLCSQLQNRAAVRHVTLNAGLSPAFAMLLSRSRVPGPVYVGSRSAPQSIGSRSTLLGTGSARAENVL
jgi:hypothetical protein